MRSKPLELKSINQTHKKLRFYSDSNMVDFAHGHIAGEIKFIGSGEVKNFIAYKEVLDRKPENRNVFDFKIPPNTTSITVQLEASTDTVDLTHVNIMTQE